MFRARALAVAGLIVFYGAVGARQPAVRVAVPLPVPADVIAAAVDLPSSDTATLLLNITRVLYDMPAGANPAADKRRRAVHQSLFTPNARAGEAVPVPLDPSIWRDTILQQRVQDQHLVAGILADRGAALLYYGLSALDDETLAWLGPDRATLLHLRAHPGAFAAFGRAIRVTAGHIVVPGGPGAEPLWASLVGVEPERAGAFVQRLFREDGRLAFFYDTVAHLDPARQRFAMGLQLPEAAREDRLRALFETFAMSSPEWHVSDRPFSRPQLDGAVMLGTLAVTPGGEIAGPRSRRLWERVFRNDELIDVMFSEVSANDVPRDDPGLVDAAWLASRILRVPYTLGRRRLDVFLFGQRVFAGAAPDPADLGTALRGVEAFPALMLSLERLGITQAAAYVDAARSAELLNAIQPEAQRRASIMSFQSALGIIERAQRSGGLSVTLAHSLTRGLTGLSAMDTGPYSTRLMRWVQSDFADAFAPDADREAASPVEGAVIAALAGATGARSERPMLEWEGRRYRVDPAASEQQRISAIRDRQAGASLDEALAAVQQGTVNGRADANTAAELELAQALASILYAAHLGVPDTPAVTSGNVAVRHDFGFDAPGAKSRSSTPWRLPAEEFASRGGWRLRGSLLGLEAALGRLSLRRLDPTAMPDGPQLGSSDLQTLMLTAALFDPLKMTNAARDEIAAALGRGRARAGALRGDPAELDRVARDAGLGEWRRQTLAWTVEHEPARVMEQFSPVELFWLGAPRPSLFQTLDAWGAAAQPLSGCLCLQMPAAKPAEDLGGRPTAGVLATRFADVALQLAATLASLDVPASLAPGVLGFAMQDVIDRARPAYPDEPGAFGRAAAELSRDRVIDYIAALTAGGPLVPAEPPAGQR